MFNNSAFKLSIVHNAAEMAMATSARLHLYYSRVHPSTAHVASRLLAVQQLHWTLKPPSSAHLDARDCCLCVKVVVHGVPYVIWCTHQHCSAAKPPDQVPLNRVIEVPAGQLTDSTSISGGQHEVTLETGTANNSISQGAEHAGSCQYDYTIFVLLVTLTGR